MTFRYIRIALASVASVCLIACNQPTSVAKGPVLESGYWQATITLPGAEIETGLEISNDGDIYQASLVNGQERVRIS
jgi:hypothetical protein